VSGVINPQPHNWHEGWPASQAIGHLIPNEAEDTSTTSNHSGFYAGSTQAWQLMAIGGLGFIIFESLTHESFSVEVRTIPYALALQQLLVSPLAIEIRAKSESIGTLSCIPR
jgi:hypothetical protein